MFPHTHGRGKHAKNVEVLSWFNSWCGCSPVGLPQSRSDLLVVPNSKYVQVFSLLGKLTRHRSSRKLLRRQKSKTARSPHHTARTCSIQGFCYHSKTYTNGRQKRLILHAVFQKLSLFSFDSISDFSIHIKTKTWQFLNDLKTFSFMRIFV